MFTRIFFISLTIAVHYSGSTFANSPYLELCGKPADLPDLTPAELELNALALQAHDILRKNCASCHSPQSRKGSKTFSDILNVEELLSRRIVIANQPHQSLLLTKIIDGTMPPNAPPMSKAEKDILTQWIAEDARPFSAATSRLPKVELIRNEDLQLCMAQDISTLGKRDRPFIRYLTLATLYNSGRQTELLRTRAAVNKLLNSLSWKKTIKNAEAVDGTSTLLRVDLRDYGWTNEVWDAIARRNPYRPLETGTQLQAISSAVNSGYPFVRADWLISEASRAPLYDRILFELSSPVKDFDPKHAVTSLERALRVSTINAVARGEIVSAGFRQSNITKSNRIIRRIETPYGAYWRSEDFISREGRRNIFEHPSDADFDGGEFIFSLPNGLHGYLVANKKGERLDSVPPEIAVDPLRLHSDGRVINGTSCMSCHTRGTKQRSDEIRTFFEKIEKGYDGRPLPPEQELKLALVRDEYPGNEALDEIFDQDEKAYITALTKTGNHVGQPEPVSTSIAQYEAPLSARDLAAELEVSLEHLISRLQPAAPLVSRLGLDEDHSLPRDQLTEHLRALKSHFQAETGIYLNSFSDFDPHFDFSIIDGTSFILKSGTPSTSLAEINYQFEMQTTEVTQRLWKKVMNGENPSQFKGDDLPVDTVAWDDAQRFVIALNKHPDIQDSNYSYRLPNGHEWEFAARGANFPDADMGAAHFFGSAIHKLTDFAWFQANSKRTTNPVKHASKQPNPAGLYDIYGNVWEWITDELYENGVATVTRFMRGGSFFEGAGGISSNAVRTLPRFAASSNIGFRLVRVTKDGSRVKRTTPVIVPIEDKVLENLPPPDGKGGY